MKETLLAIGVYVFTFLAFYAFVNLLTSHIPRVALYLGYTPILLFTTLPIMVIAQLIPIYIYLKNIDQTWIKLILSGLLISLALPVLYLIFYHKLHIVTILYLALSTLIPFIATSYRVRIIKLKQKIGSNPEILD